MLRELFRLISMLFSSKPSKFSEVELTSMKHFPFKGYSAMMWCGRLIARNEEMESLVKRIERFPSWKNHEFIHLQQAWRYKTWAGYYLRYLWEWFKGNPIFNIHSGAYYTIPFEVEAYANEENLEYKTIGNLKGSKYDLKKRTKLFRENRRGWKSYVRGL